MSDEFTAEEKAAFEAMQTEETPQESTAEAKEEESQPAEGATEQPAEVKEASEQDKKKPPEGFVPHGAMHKEREARKGLEAELEKLKGEMEALKNPPDPEPQYADPLENPEAFKKYQDAALANVNEQIKQIQQAEQARQEQVQMVSEINAFEQQFAQAQPDYNEAMTHLRDWRISDLAQSGFSQQEIAAHIATDMKALYTAGKAAGINPAQLAYLRAQEIGYKRATPEADKMAAQAKAQQATQSFPQTGGAPQAGGLTMEALANMSDAEFAKVSDADLAKVMGQ